MNFKTLGRLGNVTVGHPNLTALVVAANQAALAMGQAEPGDPRVRDFLEELLYKPQAHGGKELWHCFTMGIITSAELRNGVLARLATWLSDENGVREPSSETWCTPELERTFDSALFVAPDADARVAAHEEFIAAVNAIATAGLPGAVLLLEAERDSVAQLRDRGASDANLNAIFLEASQMAARDLPDSTSARTSWRGHEFALPGAREILTEAAKTLVTRLLAHPDCGRVSWRVVLTRVFPREAIRTHCCDPGYDLAGISGSVVAWVEPYAGDDWRESQRYPMTEIVFRDH